MKFLSLRIDNLFSIGAASVKLDYRGLCLVSGHSWDEGSSNGAGKSSLINKSLIWALFGETPGGIKGDDVVNRWMPENDYSGAILDFEVGGVLYSVIRARSPKTELKLIRAHDGLDLSHREARTTQELINNMIGRDLNSFLYTDFFGQGLDLPFLSLPPKDQRGIVESVLPFEKLSVWEENSKKAIKLVKEEIDKQQKIKLELKTKLSTIVTHLTNLFNQSIIWESRVVIEKTSIYKELNESFREDFHLLPGLMDELSSIQDYPQANDRLSYLDRIIEKASKEEIKALVNVEILNKEVNNLRIQLSTQKMTCPTCGNPWTQAEKVLSEHLVDKELNLNDIQTIIESTKLANVIARSEKKEIETLLKKRETLEAKIVELHHLEAKRASLKDKLDKLVDQPSPYQEIIEATTKDSESTKVNFKLTEDRTSKLESELRTLEILERAFGVEVKNLLFERVCPFLENRVQRHLEGLNNSQIRVVFSTVKSLKSGKIRDEFNVAVQSASGGSNYDSFSGGEKQMVNFAVGLALSDLANTQVSTRSNLLILDEPFMALDQKNSEAIVTYLSSEEFKHKDSIFIISNEQDLQSLVPENIRVEKKNGLTSVVS